MFVPSLPASGSGFCCIVHMTFNIMPPKNVLNLFGNWLAEVAKNDKAHSRVGVSALLSLFFFENKHFVT
jgi:hypothetical protein